jgi:proteasome lid subunit RPN8/RPN11
LQDIKKEQNSMPNKRERVKRIRKQKNASMASTIPLKLLYSSLVFASKQAELAAKDNGKEICGLFLEMIHVRNKCKAGGGFSFYVNEIRAIKKMMHIFNHEIIGTFHSHPVGLAKPSKSDIYYAINNSLMLIFDVLGKKHALWHIKDKEAKPVRFDALRVGRVSP